MSENITAYRLKKARAEKRINQDDVAEACGITRVSLARYESGARFPKADIVSKLASYYGVTSDYLLGNDDESDLEAQTSSDRMRRFMEEASDLNEDEMELVSMFLKQVKNNRK
jgi:transcriptional regulator with XRE-family HTH domain